ncbi:hypothetical protein ABH991_005631 [Bradyrhizobium ottawaense]|uniref:Uncharacterized protein n=1 Tax=Bradyrhizobium ottawaense TaxID=931866 RepID=A0ABV4G3A1_9BRAD|nr:hypothetical protein [Bradyrhizobium sp. CCBAU 25360]MDA9482717.1 hypothetical protein [Bradyrhizobium sp. CCBAU 11445]BBO05843.1 hypothetical protein SG09_51930 [Bradyrhizobium ottawaense]GMO22680.1 hypothetical protein BwSF12_15120 [Bradyrhizobium ottawaense]GMO44205.1 hypothetical protein BwSF21_58550 [Bradyrhizobium ottawaense]
MRHQKLPKSLIVALAAVAPLVAGCSGTDLLSKDAQWFNTPSRLFIKNISIESPPLTPDKAVGAEDLVSADGGCPGMAPPPGPADANASTTAPAPTGGTVALGHTECDVVRGIGAPSNVNLSNDAVGRRVAVVTWAMGPRAGIYTFTAGRLSSIEGNPDPQPVPRATKPKPKKHA